MQKKLLVAAVAGALAAPAAFAQSSVTISGALYLDWQSVAATGATLSPAVGTNDVKSRDRLSDGAGSNIRFSVVEDLGGGLQGFGQVESAAFSNSNTRSDPSNGGAAASTSGWANRDSGVGLRSSAWGEILMGVWDVHYLEHVPADSQLLRIPSDGASWALLNQFGTSGNATGGGGLGSTQIGGRMGDVIRYQSPSWSGFNFRAIYARPNNGAAPSNLPGTPADQKKERVYNFAPAYVNGPIAVGWSYLRDSDFVVAATSFWGTPMIPVSSVGKITSNKFWGAYTFPMGFKIGFIWDNSKLDVDSGTPGTSQIKRDTWVLPLSYSTGPHTIDAYYAKAKSWKGNFLGTDFGSINPVVGGATYSASGDTGARMLGISYTYALSKRTAANVAYAAIRNDALAGYDFYANPVGMGASSFGADPRLIGIGLRHTF